MSARAGAPPWPVQLRFVRTMTESSKRFRPNVRRGLRRCLGAAVSALALLLGLPHGAPSSPIEGDQGVLPAGSELNEDAAYVPHEILSSEYRGDRTSYVVALGNVAFNSPNILGDVARRAGVSCGTCHIGGSTNAKLFIPGMSTKPRTFHTTPPPFHPHAH